MEAIPLLSDREFDLGPILVRPLFDSRMPVFVRLGKAVVRRVVPFAFVAQLVEPVL